MSRLLSRSATAAALCVITTFAHAQDKVRISFNPQIYSYLPIFLAIDNGYFKAENLDIDITTYGGSALSQIPMLARGDQDIAGMATGPAFYNQHSEGFGIKLIASMAQAKKGWHDTIWVMVRKDVRDSGAIKTLADLKGKNIEGGPKGSPIYLASVLLIGQAGLTMKDVTFTERLRSITDSLPLFKNKAIDVLTMVEPVVTRLESEGLAVRWMPSYEIMPWFQEAFIAANPKFLTAKRDVTKRFLRAYMKGMDEILAAEGKWTPAMLASVTKWSKFPKEVIEKIPGPQNPGPRGEINLQSIERLQQFWIDAGMVKEKRPVAEFVDTTIIDEVRKESGR
nr:ABC transporter substrate-binding protein [Nitrosomonas nitrosa]